jgi:phosphohistidine phosphatase SixA
VIVYLVRHARAGKRSEWEGDDRLRPLDERGRLQADALVEQLDGRDFSRIVSSPYVRCVQSVEPVSQARGTPVEPREELAEGAGREAGVRLLIAAGAPVVASVHGDLVEELLGEKLKKGATAVLDLREDGLDVLERLPPPA